MDYYICNSQTEQDLAYPSKIITDCMGAMETLDLFPEFAINHTFYPWKFFTDGQLDTEARCLFKVHFDYDLREDQVNSLIFRSQNLTTYWDVKYHVGPCFS
jgi:hypothetical protein